MASADDRYWRVEIEEDGLPAQLAPKHRQQHPDDPREPWSPNYGTKPPRPGIAAATPASAAGSEGRAATTVAAPAPVPSLHRPESASPSVSPRPAVARTADLDADAIIRRAIAEHEMRRRD